MNALAIIVVFTIITCFVNEAAACSGSSRRFNECDRKRQECDTKCQEEQAKCVPSTTPKPTKPCSCVTTPKPTTAKPCICRTTPKPTTAKPCTCATTTTPKPTTPKPCECHKPTKPPCTCAEALPASLPPPHFFHFDNTNNGFSGDNCIADPDHYSRGFRGSPIVSLDGAPLNFHFLSKRSLRKRRGVNKEAITDESKLLTSLI